MGIIIKNQGKQSFTTMFNNHFMDKRLSWAAVGMLSNVFSLPDGWEFSVKGFMGMHSDGERVVRSALFELEWFGYLERIQIRNEKGQVMDYDYEFFNESQLPEKTDPVPKWKDRPQFKATRVKIVHSETGEVLPEKPKLQNVVTEDPEPQKPERQNADMDNADVGFAYQSNTNISNTKQLNTNNINSYPILSSNNNYNSVSKADYEKMRYDVMEQINYLFLCEHFRDIDVDAWVDLMLDIKITNEDTLTGAKLPTHLVRDRIASINPYTMLYIISEFMKNETPIQNMRSYMIKCLYNGPTTHAPKIANNLKSQYSLFAE